MNREQFLQQANPMLNAVDEAMSRMFGKRQTEEEIREKLEKAEDEFIARKAAEQKSN